MSTKSARPSQNWYLRYVETNETNSTSSKQMFTITYQVPYNNCEWRTQSFPTLDEAERMVAFYISCGSPAKLV